MAINPYQTNPFLADKERHYHKIEKFEIRSITDYINAIFSKPQDSSFKNFYRGMKSKSYSLIPSIFRKNEHHSLINENEINKRIRREFPDFFSNDLACIELLAKKQHYGIPTRLLDITDNPLVALFFATEPFEPEKNQTPDKEEKSEEQDGKVICFALNPEDTDYSFFEKLLAFYEDRRSFNFDNFLKSIRRESTKGEFNLRLALNQYFEWADNSKSLNTEIPDEANAAAEYILEYFNNPHYIQTEKYNIRQKAQSGSFLLFPNKVFRKAINMARVGDFGQEENITESEKYITKKFIIKEESKKNIRENLHSLGIDKIRLFNDDIEAVCKEIVKNVEEFIN